MIKKSIGTTSRWFLLPRVVNGRRRRVVVLRGSGTWWCGASFGGCPPSGRPRGSCCGCCCCCDEGPIPYGRPVLSSSHRVHIRRWPGSRRITKIIQIPAPLRIVAKIFPRIVGPYPFLVGDFGLQFSPVPSGAVGRRCCCRTRIPAVRSLQFRYHDVRASPARIHVGLGVG